MTGICVAAITVMALQGCGSSGTVATGASGGVGGRTGGPTTPPATSTTSPATTPAPGAASSTAQPPTSANLDTDPFAVLTSEPTTTAPAPPPGSGSWTPPGELANAAPIDTVLNADKSVTATWPKGAPAGHALTIKLKGSVTGGKLIVHLSADNQSGQKVSLMTGMFGGATALDAQGNSLNFDEMDPAWTLTDSGDGNGDLVPGQPMSGNIVMDAPKSGSTFNIYWQQALESNGIMSGIILIRNIPIS